MNPFRADLHTHTCCSDGRLSPKDLIGLAKQTNLQGLCITDHDTVDAYTEAIAEAEKAKILLGCGVEFSSVLDGHSVHILGYDVQHDSPLLHEFCQRHQKRRLARNAKILKKLETKGIFLKEEELLALGEKASVLGRPHIAELMIKKGYVSSLRQAFESYLGEEASCFVQGEAFSVDETIALIHQVGGKAFLAHPHLLKRRRLIREVLLFPFDGIECYYARLLPGSERRWIQIAHEKGWLVSGGSDFHGAINGYSSLGSSWVGEEVFLQIFSRVYGSR